jgi:signal transduction histidine kinase
MPSGGSLRVATSREGEAAVLRVADSGPGIAPDSRDRIFEPFFTTKDSGGGTGLGLAVCRQIVDTHGGTIQVTDAPGGGAAFEVRLPLAAAEAVA